MQRELIAGLYIKTNWGQELKIEEIACSPEYDEKKLKKAGEDKDDIDDYRLC